MSRQLTLCFTPLDSLIELNGTQYITSGSPTWSLYRGWVDRDNVNTGLVLIHPSGDIIETRPLSQPVTVIYEHWREAAHSLPSAQQRTAEAHAEARQQKKPTARAKPVVKLNPHL